MAEAKKKDPEFRTPRAPWKYPKLDKVDYGTKDFPKPDGEFSVQVVMKADAPETKAFLAKLAPLYAEAEEQAQKEFKELKVETRKKIGKIKMNPLFTTIYDQDTEEPTGEISFKIAMPASGEYEKNGKKIKWSKKPGIFDAMGKPIAKVPEIWGGSEGIVSFSARPYFIKGTGAGGLKLKLLAAQVIKLVQGGSRDAAGYGFGVEEGGYAHQDSIGDDEKMPGGDDEDGDNSSSADSTDGEDF